MLIEDCALTRKMYRFALQAAKYDVVEADGVAAAKEAVCARRPDAMIIDYLLEDGQGADLASFIRSQSEYNDTILISISSTQGDGYKHAIQVAPFDSRLKKPLKPADLVNELGRLFTSAGKTNRL